LDKPYSLAGVGRYALRTTQNREAYRSGRTTPSPRVSWRAEQASIPAVLHWLDIVGQPDQLARCWRGVRRFTLNSRQQMVVAFLIGRERTSLAYPQNSRPRMHIIVSRER